jgi:meiotically up-regulated gene 157 (Mug157) protein
MTPQRPHPEERAFRSQRVDALIADVSAEIGDPGLARLFEYCLPNTLDTATQYETTENGVPDTFIISGDIPAMWLRDSVCQIWPYIPYIKDEPALERMVEGLVRRQTRCLLFDPYANAFLREKSDRRENPRDKPAMKPGVWCRRWQIDSFGYFMRLSHAYWKEGGNVACFDEDWTRAARSMVEILQTLQAGSDELPRPDFQFQRMGYEPYESLPLAGYGPPCRRCGLVRNAFRPSDDASLLPFHIPGNAMAAVGLRQLAEMASALKLDATLAHDAAALAHEIGEALDQRAVYQHPKHGPIWAYEVDGYGSTLLMDDANYPNLLGLPYLGFRSADDSLYRNTRAFILGPDNPYWTTGRAMAGLGGPHCATVYGENGQTREGLGVVWPIGVIMQGLTSSDEAEILSCLTQLARVGIQHGFMPEAVWKDDAAFFRRKWFCWANVFFGELVLSLHQTRPDLLRDFRSDRQTG